MKRIYNLLLIFPIFIFGQSSDQNYIKSTTYKKETTTPLSNPDIEDANIQINYFDGLGRPIQQIAHKQSNSGKDVIVHLEYDEFGRQSKEFLPYVRQTASLDIDLGAQNNQLNYYSSSTNPNFEITSAPFSEKIFDFSPLNRVLKQAAPGNAWKKDSGHEIKFDYDLNTLSDEVFNFSANRTAGSTDVYNYSLTCAGYHNPNTLYKNVVKNENWVSGKNNTTEEYKNDLGKVILKRTYNESQKYDTYYVYDVIGNLIYVVPPLASDNIAQVQINTTPYVYSQSIGFSQFIINANGVPITSGGGGMTISIQNSTISLNLSGSWSGSGTFDLTKQFEINAIYPIPDMTLGYVDFNYNGNHQFIVKIANNRLYFEDYTPNDPVLYFSSLPSISQNLTKSLPTSLFQNIITYSHSTNFSLIENLGYQYKYDSRNRLVEKKLPGKAWEFIVYDKLDRPVASGPAYNPYGTQTLGWMITQYDVFGRVTQTGWKQMTVSETERKNNQNTINSGGNPFVLVQSDILTKNFYDNYSFAGAPTMPQTVEGEGAITAVKGLQTGSWVKVLDTPGSTTAEISYTLYDYKYRPIRTRTTNFLGGYTEVDSKLDWAGRVQKTVTKHKYNTNATVLTTTETFTYSPQDKLVLHKHKINVGTEMLLAKNNYDELGQLIRKEVGGQDFTGANSYQKIDYKYNIRGWLKEINDVDSNADSDLFAFKINYNEGTNPLYNGNISETYWKSESDNVLRKYEYHYDNLNRLLLANYSKPLSTSIPSAFTTNSYLEKMDYDKNGNITSLVRNGDLDSNDFAIEIDDLVYTYDANNKNKLLKVFDQSNHPQGFKDDSNGITDPADDYEYDVYGNLIKDTNKEIANITYNHLNLPSKITFVNGNFISYIYNALGQKVQKKVTELTTMPKQINYMLGGYQYTNDVLNFFPHAEGYVNVTFGRKGAIVYNYVYQYKDHLGNNRLSYTVDPSYGDLTILEESHYYPFGLKHTSYNTTKYEFVEVEDGANYYINITQLPAGYSSAYKYKYNGKEYQDELGLNMYDYGARNYDPALGRWMNVDPLAEQYRRWSPYNYVMNSPMILVDPDGMRVSYGDFIDNAGDNEDNYYIRGNGEIHVETTDDKTDSFYLETLNNQGGTNSALIGTFEKNESGLIQLPSTLTYENPDFNADFSFTVKEGNEYRSYISGEALAALFGALASTNTKDLTVVGFSLSDGSSPAPSVSHKNGRNGDFRYLRTDKSGDAVLLGQKELDVPRQNDFNAALHKFGWKSMLSEKFTPYKTFGQTLLDKATHYNKSRHHNHLHTQGFKPNLIQRTN